MTSQFIDRMHDWFLDRYVDCVYWYLHLKLWALWICALMIFFLPDWLYSLKDYFARRKSE